MLFFVYFQKNKQEVKETRERVSLQSSLRGRSPRP